MRCARRLVPLLLLALGAPAVAADAARLNRLADQLVHGTPYQRSEAAAALQREGAAAAGCADTIAAATAAAIDAREWRQAALGVDTLRAVKPEALAACVPGVERALDGGVREVRKEAARLSVEFAAAGAPLAPTLASLATDADCGVDALHALAAIGPAAPPVLPTLLAVAQGKDPALARAAIDALADLGPRAKEVVPALAGLLGRPETRAPALSALASLGHAAADAVPRMIEIGRSANADERPLVVRALKQVESDDIAPTAQDATATCREGGTVELTLPAGDDDDLLSSLRAAVDAPKHGELVPSGGLRVGYRAAWGFVGDEVIAWRANDGAKDGQPARLTITVTADPDPAAATSFVLLPDRKTLRVAFDKPLERASAEAAARYALDHGVTVTAARLDQGQTAVELLTSGLEPDAAYALSIHGLADQAAVARTTDVDGIAVRARITAPGLAGRFFTGTALAGQPIATVVSPTIDFPNGPRPDLGDYSAQWNGFVEAPAAGTWTFSATSDDGVRVWVDGKQLIDGWRSQPPTEYSGTIDLPAHAQRAIRIEYYQGSGGQALTLSWASASVPKQVVPASALSSAP